MGSICFGFGDLLTYCHLSICIRLVIHYTQFNYHDLISTACPQPTGQGAGRRERQQMKLTNCSSMTTRAMRCTLAKLRGKAAASLCSAMISCTGFSGNSSPGAGKNFSAPALSPECRYHPSAQSKGATLVRLPCRRGRIFWRISSSRSDFHLQASHEALQL